MKLYLAGLALCLLMAGCATPPPAAEASASAKPVTAQSGPTRPASIQSVIPSGPLDPITAAEATSRGVAFMQPPTDLWDRIRRGFKMQNLDTDLVRQQEQFYASRPDYMQRMTERSRKYLFHIVEELERRDMPTELALLPFIESAFNPQAVSSARAAGMWQFMPATGTHFELKQNVFRDDRRDVLASTRAALDYLQKLYGMFGDWHLALAAYNWGEGSVGRAIAKNQRLGLRTSYTDLNMPNETRFYVPKLQAVKNIVANPEQFRAELPFIGNHPYFQTVTVERDIDVALAASLADVSLEDFKALNPSMNRPVILAAGTPQILLPWDNATIFKRNFEAHTAGQYASWTAWSAPATMSSSEAAKRVGMSEADLRSINNIPPRMLIKAGSVLIVPRSAKNNDDVASHVADNGQLSLQPEQVTRKTTVKAGKRDTITTIARRHRLNPMQVAEWNSMGANAALHAGQQVVVYLPVRVAAPGAGRASARSHSVRRTSAAKPALRRATKAPARAPSKAPAKRR
ncbi:transglycosylase SLT domain-containing protein [Caenimonas koreensis]|uniref:Transglycosylase SLT domain-containing protein n=1 Tax=Caenimonas koreensis DSM 17982 TaxID=1121255 RepID=A0A844B920_9BURK|nr:transglycosylase SLT domain-containing protein [Caenimonas koreensis]MRD48099.1 transglycosylase SLT domain-containing protein [Caenimonas koreensis DSM 17982]